MDRRSLCLLGLALAGAAQAAGTGVLQVCIDETPHTPWRLAAPDGRLSGKGLEFEFLELLATRGWDLQWRLRPWKRCMVEAQSGQVDLVMGASHTAERAQVLRYPMTGDQPDAARAVRSDQYQLVVRASQAARWDGERLLLEGPQRMAVQLGFSSVKLAQALGFEPEERARTTQGVLEHLLRGQVPVALLLHTELQQFWRDEPGLAARLRLLDPPLAPRPYFLAASWQLSARDPALLNKLWADVATVRESAAYRALLERSRVETPEAQ
ncbi:polar amino acid transport system substrate-binding protein [Inhella inkyongensis]|uniref:Polar amino acid transport system substrate-binding protein n=1 Tax=Inhella inkyongensis TaxID=392593 RepID=A0A840S5S1_9BURK|nr:transporter substrate-binding domain-containing protein [Inhella inkyongensis]MBB5204922.1 polar amino acid transport system substrate-binding protein [Inhella inkyongensis]